MTTAEQITALAHAFDAELRQTISESDYRDALAMNRNEADAQVCHSHDYCDANEVMACAFGRVTGRDMDLQSEVDRELWSAAWSEWKARDVVTDDERSNGPRR